MRFLLRITALLMLPPMLMSCASYEFGEYPLTQSEISYFSRVDPSAAIVTDLGGNTFDVENPTIHAVFTDFLASWAGRQAYISFDRFTDIAFNMRAQFPNVERAYLTKISETCQRRGLIRSDGQVTGDFTIRYRCLGLSQWIQKEQNETIQNCRSLRLSEFSSIYTRRGPNHHPCTGSYGVPFPVTYCDAFTEATGVNLLGEYSCSDLVDSYDQGVKTKQQLVIADQAATERQDQCKAFGFTDDTPEMANCLLELYKIANQPQQNTVITNSAPARTNSSDTTSGIELMNRGLQILNGVGTPSTPSSRTSTCTRIGDFSGQVVTFNSIACPAGYAPTF
jgi:hypothetical protein